MPPRRLFAALIALAVGTGCAVEDGADEPEQDPDSDESADQSSTAATLEIHTNPTVYRVKVDTRAAKWRTLSTGGTGSFSGLSYGSGTEPGVPWAEVLALGGTMPGKLTFVADGAGSFEPTAILIPDTTFAERRIGALAVGAPGTGKTELFVPKGTASAKVLVVSTFALEEQIANPKANVQDSGRYTVFWEP